MIKEFHRHETAVQVAHPTFLITFAPEYKGVLAFFVLTTEGRLRLYPSNLIRIMPTQGYIIVTNPPRFTT